MQREPTHRTEATRRGGGEKQNYTAKADDNPRARARATAMTQPAGEKKKSLECRARASSSRLVETLYLRGTSRQRSPAAPALTSPTVHTHLTSDRKRKKNRSLYVYEVGEQKSLWKKEKQKRGGEIAPKKRLG